MSKIKLTEQRLHRIICEAVNKTLQESFEHWQSPKLAQMVKQHGMPYGNTTSHYMYTQLSDKNVGDVVDRPSTKQYIKFADGTYADIDYKDNETARDYFHMPSGSYVSKYAPKVRPNNSFTRVKDMRGNFPLDAYSRRTYVGPTQRAQDARDLRHNPYFQQGKNHPKRRDDETGWNRESANWAMNNLRKGKDRYGNDNNATY